MSFKNHKEDIHGKLKRYYKYKCNEFIENPNIVKGCLNCSKLHLHKKGTVLLAKNITNVVKYILGMSNSGGEFKDTKKI